MGFLKSIVNGVGSFLGSTGLPGISGLGNWITGEVSKSEQKAATASERAWQEKLISEQRKFNLEQWNRENEYNDPSQQMSRLKSAGLNPDMVYGQGGITNVAAHSPFQSNIGSTNVPNMAAFRVSPLEQAQIAKLNSETKLTNKKADSSLEFRPDWQSLQFKLGESVVQLNESSRSLSDSRRSEVEASVKRLLADADSISQSIQESKARTSLLDVQKQAQLLENYWIDDRNKAVIDELMSRTKLNREQSKNIAEYYLSQIGVLDKTRVKLDHESEKVVAETGQIIATTNGIRFDIDSKESNEALNNALSIFNVISGFISSIR